MTSKLALPPISKASSTSPSSRLDTCWREKSGGSIVSITATLAKHPIAGVSASVPKITKGGLESITRSRTMEYVKDGIRVNAVAPGIVDTPMPENDPREF